MPHILVVCVAVYFLFHPALQQSSSTQSTEPQIDQNETDLVPVMLHEPPPSRSKSPKSHIGPDGIPRNDAASLELMEVLDKWESASRTTEPTVLSIRRTAYDLEQRVETHSYGEFIYESPKRMGVFLRAPDPFGIAGRKEVGNHFRVEAGPSKSRILAGKFLWIADDVAKSYEEIEIPPRGSGKPKYFEHWVELPFFFDIRSSRIRKEWSLSLAKSKDHFRIVKAVPESGMWKDVVKHILVMIDLTSGKTSAVKLVLNSEKAEIVYAASSRRKIGSYSQNRLEPNWKKDGYVRAPSRGWLKPLPTFEP